MDPQILHWLSTSTEEALSGVGGVEWEVSKLNTVTVYPPTYAEALAEIDRLKSINLVLEEKDNATVRVEQ